MSATAWFALVGSVGLVMVVGSLVLGDFMEGLFESLDIDPGGGVFSTPVIGSFLAVFGFGAVLTQTAAGAGAALAAIGGTAGGLMMAGVALWVTRSLMDMPTDEAVRTEDVVGKAGVVVSAIPVGGFGEVSLVHLGQRLKYNARAHTEVPYGADVVVVAVTSPSSVFVEPATEFWGAIAPLNQGD